MVARRDIKPEREMVVCYPPDDVPMVPDPKHPGRMKPDVTWLITEDDEPVDGPLSERQMALLRDPLLSLRGPDGKSRYVVFANVGLFFSPTEPPIVPDVMVTTGVAYPEDWDRKESNAYFMWEYEKAPDVAFEIVSNRKGGEDSTKLATYARVGVRWYVIFDPKHRLSNDELKVFKLSRKKYKLVKDRYFPELELGITLWEGEYGGGSRKWVRWCHKDGTLLPTGDEQGQRADQEKGRANAANKRANAEQKRADTAEEKNRRLMERLKQLGETIE